MTEATTGSSTAGTSSAPKPNPLAPPQSPTDTKTTQAAATPLQGAQKPPQTPTEKPKVTPAVPQLFQSSDTSGAVEKELLAIAEAEKTNVAHFQGQKPENQVQEDYALAKFYIDVNDALETGGFPPAFDNPKKVINMPNGTKREVVFLPDRIIITGISESEAPAILKHMQTLAAQGTNKDFSEDQKQLLRDLSPGSAKTLATEQINAATKAAKHAANEYIRSLVQKLHPGVSVPPKPMKYVEQARTSTVQQASLPGAAAASSTPKSQPWSQQFQSGMKTNEEFFRNLIRSKTFELKTEEHSKTKPTEQQEAEEPDQSEEFSAAAQEQPLEPGEMKDLRKTKPHDDAGTSSAAPLPPTVEGSATQESAPALRSQLGRIFVQTKTSTQIRSELKDWIEQAKKIKALKSIYEQAIILIKYFDAQDRFILAQDSPTTKKSEQPKLSAARVQATKALKTLAGMKAVGTDVTIERLVLPGIKGKEKETTDT